MDRETAITHLQIIHTWALFARERDLQFFTPKHLEDIAQWSDDVLALLKEQYKLLCKKQKDIDKLQADYAMLRHKFLEKTQIVRCKDCKHGQYEEWDNGECVDKTVFCDGYGIHKPDWFCADGKK